MTTSIKYNLEDFHKISFHGFNFTIPEHTINLISSLAMEVGSPTYIKTPVFQKKDIQKNNNYGNTNADYSTFKNKKRKNNSNDKLANDEWETLRSFQTTKIEQKTGVDGEIDKIRLYLNKLTDKTFHDIKEKIFEIINNLVQIETDKPNMNKVAVSIFEIASNNKFYSKLYADLFTELIRNYSTYLYDIFHENYSKYLDLFKTIECGDPEKDYDAFCEINKRNDKRKAISQFFVNLTINQLITNTSLTLILKDLLDTILRFIDEPDKRNEVDEITENIAILYNKDIIDPEHETYIVVAITKLAKSKAKDYKSLTNKAIFKFMDLIDM